MYVHCIHNCPLIFFQKFQTKYSADRKKKEKKKERKDVVRYINRKEKKSHQTKKKEVASITIEDAPPLSLDNTLSQKNKKKQKKNCWPVFIQKHCSYERAISLLLRGSRDEMQNRPLHITQDTQDVRRQPSLVAHIYCHMTSCPRMPNQKEKKRNKNAESIA